MPFAGSGTTQQPSARAGLSSSRYAATDDPLAVLPPRINHSKPPQGEQQATSMAHQSAVWSMTQTTDLPARSSASTKATAQAMTAGNNRANRESAQKQDAAMHAAPTTGPSFEPTAPAQPLTQSETIDHQQARTRGAEPASVSMQLEPSQGIKHPTNVLNPSPAPRADSNQVQDRATPCQGKMPCFGSCGQWFDKISDIAKHVEGGACSVKMRSTDIYKTAATCESRFLFIHGRYHMDMELDRDLTKKYYGNAWPFFCPKQPCEEVFRNLGELFDHVESGKCVAGQELGEEPIRELVDALQYIGAHGLL